MACRSGVMGHVGDLNPVVEPTRYGDIRREWIDQIPGWLLAEFDSN